MSVTLINHEKGDVSNEKLSKMSTM